MQRGLPARKKGMGQARGGAEHRARRITIHESWPQSKLRLQKRGRLRVAAPLLFPPYFFITPRFNKDYKRVCDNPSNYFTRNWRNAARALLRHRNNRSFDLFLPLISLHFYIVGVQIFAIFLVISLGPFPIKRTFFTSNLISLRSREEKVMGMKKNKIFRKIMGLSIFPIYFSTPLRRVTFTSFVLLRSFCFFVSFFRFLPFSLPGEVPRLFFFYLLWSSSKFAVTNRADD